MTDAEKLAAIRQIKQRHEPPFDEWDVFNRRCPWPKFGEWYDIYYEIWVWYSDNYIMANADDRMIQEALDDIELFEGGDAVECS